MGGPKGLIAITPEESRGDGLEHRVLRALLGGGFFRFHLRRPNWDLGRTRAWLEPLNPDERKFVVVHDHHTLAHEMNLGGVHHNRRCPWPAEKGAGLKIGFPTFSGETGHPITRSVSAHSLEEVIFYQSGTAGHPHYLTLSPVYPSQSKPGYEAPQLLADYSRERAAHPGDWGVPVFALGGVDLRNLVFLKSAGFSGAAVLGGLWGSPGEEPEILVKGAKIWSGANPW